jgi:hypothetical protein
MLILLIIIGVVVLIIGTMAFFQWRANPKTFTMAGFLHTFGIDVSEGIESLIYGTRTIILLGLEVLFAHLEALTLHETMAYKHGSYEIGLAIALVAMVTGMTFSTELKLQFDRMRNIKPAIKALNISAIAKAEMEAIYKRKVGSSWFILCFALVIAIGMHAAIVSMSVVSLMQHQEYSKLVLAGTIQPIEGIPPLHYTGWFQMPITVSSILIGSLGLVIDIMIGFTSNITEELYKYKPNGEFSRTTAELEKAFPVSGGTKTTTTTTTTPAGGTTTGPGTTTRTSTGGGTGTGTGTPTTTTTTPPTTGTGNTTPTPPTVFQSASFEPVLDKLKAAEALDVDLALNCTGSESTDVLLKDYIKAIEKMLDVTKPSLSVTDAIERYTRANNSLQTGYSTIISDAYKKLIALAVYFNKQSDNLGKIETKLADAIDRKDEKDCKDLKTEAETLLKEYDIKYKEMVACIKSTSEAINRLPA